MTTMARGYVQRSYLQDTYLRTLAQRCVSAQARVSVSGPRPPQWPASASPQSRQSDPDTLAATWPAQSV